MNDLSKPITIDGHAVPVDGDVGDKITIGDRGSPPSSIPPSPMPLSFDELPSPGKLPTGSRLPFTRNNLFTGRTAQLKSLAQALLHDQTSPTHIVRAIYGAGGVGKTQLAVEFAYRYGRYFYGVHWINAYRPDCLDNEIAACGRAMDLEDWPKEQSEQVDRTMQEWKQRRPSLVILDSVQNASAAHKCLSKLGGGQLCVLITTRLDTWPPNMGLELNVFAPDKSLDLLRRRLPADRATDDELETLAARLNHLPIALELVSRYLVYGTKTVTVYLDELAEEKDFPLAAMTQALIGLISRSNKTGRPLPFASLYHYIESVANDAQEAGREEARMLWNNLGCHYWIMDDYAQAQTALEQAIGPEPSRLNAIRYNNLGSVLQDMGNLSQALDAYERALKICERTVGLNHPYVAILVRNVGTILYESGDLPGAREAFLQALAIDKRF